METTIRHSRATSPNKNIHDWTPQFRNQDNMKFFSEALGFLNRQEIGNRGWMVIGLIGSRDIPGVALRQAQSILRWDMRPSLWSHSFLLASPATSVAALAKTRTLGVSLHPRTSSFPNPERNGVSDGTLALFQNPSVDANAALLAVNLTKEEAEKVAYRASHENLDRQRYNLWETLGVWQGYLWSFGTRPNPLREGFPIPSASFLEYCYEAIGLDLTPGASERNCAPEHIYNAAKYWHNAFKAQQRVITGCYVLRDKGCSLLSADDEERTPKRRHP